MIFLCEIVSVVLSFIILYLWGIPVLTFAEPKGLMGWRFITLPVMGFGISTLVLYYCFRINVPIVKISVATTVFVVIIDIVLLYKKIIIINKSDIIKCIITVGTVLFIGIIYFSPLGLFSDAIMCLGHGNGDWGNYGASSAIIKYSGYSVVEFGGGATLASFTTQTRGAMLLVSYFSTLFPISIWNSLDLVFFQSLIMIALTGGMLGSVIGKTKRAGVVSGLLLFFNCGYLYLIQESFFGQITSIPILIFINAYLFCLEDNYLEKVNVKETITIGVFSSFMLLIYMEQIPFLVLLFFFVLVATFMSDKKAGIILVKEYLMAILIVAFLLGERLISFFKLLTLLSGVEAGWDVPYGGLLQALGMYNVYLGTIGVGDFVEWPYLIIALASLVLFASLVVYYKKRFNGKERYLYIAIVIAFYLAYLSFLIIWGVRSYKVFKGLVNLEYFFVVSFGVMCAERLTTNKSKKNFRIVLGVGSAFLVTFVVVTGLDFYKRLFVQHSQALPDDLVYNSGSFGHEDLDNTELQRFLENHTEKMVTVHLVDVVDGCEAVVAAVEAGIPATRISDDDGYLKWNVGMVEDIHNCYNIESSIYRDPIETNGKIVLQNDTFLVREIDPKYPICKNRGKLNFRIVQNDDGYIVTGKNSNENSFSYGFMSNRDVVQNVYLKISAPEQEELSIIMNNNTIENIELQSGVNDIILDNVEFIEGENNFEIFRNNGMTFDDTWIIELAVGDKNEDPNRIKMNSVIIPTSFIGKLWKKIFGKSNLNRYIIDFAKSIGINNSGKITMNRMTSSREFVKKLTKEHRYQIDKTEYEEIEKGLLNDEKSVQMLLFEVCSVDEVITSGSNREYIEYLYQTLLNRSPDEEEIIGWLEQLNSGVPREDVFCSFLCSYEFHTKILENSAFSILPEEGSILFDKKQNNATPYILEGMSEPEEQGTWTIGRFTQIGFIKKDNKEQKISLSLYLSYVMDRQSVTIRINDEDVYSNTIDSTIKEISFEVEPSKDGNYLMEIDLPDAVSPASLGVSDDSRELGIMIRQISVR